MNHTLYSIHTVNVEIFNRGLISSLTSMHEIYTWVYRIVYIHVSIKYITRVSTHVDKMALLK